MQHDKHKKKGDADEYWRMASMVQHFYASFMLSLLSTPPQRNAMVETRLFEGYKLVIIYKAERLKKCQRSKQKNYDHAIMAWLIISVIVIMISKHYPPILSSTHKTNIFFCTLLTQQPAIQLLIYANVRFCLHIEKKSRTSKTLK